MQVVNFWNVVPLLEWRSRFRTSDAKRFSRNNTVYLRIRIIRIIIVNVRGREFKAHKNILATRSSYFAAMFNHPTKENLSNQIEIDDVDPDVFHEILRFIYTGRVSLSAMRKMSVRILAVADKYLLDQLKRECEYILTSRLNTPNCVQLLLTDKHHSAFYLRKFAVDFLEEFPAPDPCPQL